MQCFITGGQYQAVERDVHGKVIGEPYRDLLEMGHIGLYAEEVAFFVKLN